MKLNFHHNNNVYNPSYAGLAGGFAVAGINSMFGNYYDKPLKPSVTFTEENKMMIPNFDSANPGGSGQTKLKLDTRLPTPKGLSKGSVLVHDAYSQALTTNGNNKRYQWGGTVGCTNQFTQSTTNATTNRAELAYAAYFNMNISQGLPAGTNAAANSIPLADKMAVKGGTIFLDFLNLQQTSVECRVTFVVSKKDSLSTPLAEYNTSLVANAIWNTTFTEPARATGPTGNVSGNPFITYAAQTGSASENLLTPAYSSIWDHRLPKTQWKTLGHATFTLAANATHRVTASFLSNQWAMKEKLTQTSFAPYPKGCIGWYYEIQGQTLVDSSAAGTPGLSSAAVDVTINRKVRLVSFKDIHSRMDPEYYGSYLSYNAVVADYKLLNTAVEAAQVAATL